MYMYMYVLTLSCTSKSELCMKTGNFSTNMAPTSSVVSVLPYIYNQQQQQQSITCKQHVRKTVFKLYCTLTEVHVHVHCREMEKKAIMIIIYPYTYYKWLRVTEAK